MEDLLAHEVRKTDPFAMRPLRQRMAEYLATDQNYCAGGIRQLRPNVLEVEIRLLMRAATE